MQTVELKEKAPWQWDDETHLLGELHHCSFIEENACCAPPVRGTVLARSLANDSEHCSAPLAEPASGVHRAASRVRVELDVDNQVVYIGRNRFEFGPSSFAVIRYLIEQQGRWVAARELIDRALQTHHTEDSSIVRFHIHLIRKTLGADGACVVGDRKRRRGYTFATHAFAES